jgi:hypothetical protein
MATFNKSSSINNLNEQTLIAEQLQAGISNDRILENARKIRDNQLDRLNLITRGDLRN